MLNPFQNGRQRPATAIYCNTCMRMGFDVVAPWWRSQAITAHCITSLINDTKK
nr:MAG TPA: hypothetical protein [Caudoviricetes sp.]